MESMEKPIFGLCAVGNSVMVGANGIILAFGWTMLQDTSKNWSNFSRNWVSDSADFSEVESLE